MCNIFDLFIALAGKLNNCCADSVWGFFSRHADYVLKLEENLEALENIIGDLRALQDDVMRRVEVAEQQQKKRLAKVELWFGRVDDAVAEGDVLLKCGVQEVQRLCLGGYCSVNCWSTSNFGKSVDKCLKQLADLKDRGEQLGSLAEEAPKELAAELPCDATIGTEVKFNEVWSYLEDKDVGIIGLYGTGGVGKTTLLKQIRNKLVGSYNNLLVIWVVVGKSSRLEDILANIGNEIGEVSPVGIFNKLLKKRFVLLLDDIWEQVKLGEIGIPSREKLNGSKIIFTTRSLKVCSEMLAEKKIRIETLQWEHAWELFKRHVGEDTIDDPEILSLAKGMAEKCGGLPIALKPIGSAMSCKTKPWEWRYAIESLNKPVLHSRCLEDEVSRLFEVEVFSILKFSFDNLSNVKVKSCFLFCALFPDDYDIHKENLVDYWMCEDMCIDKASNEGNIIIDMLIRLCLLEENGDFVKLHDVIRDMALWIQGQNTLVMAKMELREVPSAEIWEGVKKLSLMGNKIEKLTQVPVWSNLTTLILRDNRSLKEMNEDFFQFMGRLTILDLSFASLKKLPRSIVNLVSLQYLDISLTDIEELSNGLTKLDKLKYLGLGGLQLAVKKSEKMISSLSSLEVIDMWNCEYNFLEMERG